MTLVGISAAAEKAGVSERALRYYQQLGLIAPACTSGGFRRYADHDLARVARIRELQSVLGLELDEIADFLKHEDRVREIRAAYFDAETTDLRRAELLRESLALHSELRESVLARRLSLDSFLIDLDNRIAHIDDLLNQAGTR